MGAFPEGFVRSLQDILPAEGVEALLASLDGEPATAIRFNPYKLSAPPEGEGVPWCRYGFYLDRRPNFTLDSLHHAGLYYVQEPSSMFIEHIVRELFPEPEGLRILDLCAAPGGKTTLLSTLAGLEGLVVANETISHRAAALAENVRRWGLGNIAVTANDPSHFEGVRDFFDVILVDAPCSGEGMFRKNPVSRDQWSSANVPSCAARQKRILSQAWGSLKPGGILIYSTCTFNRTENEDSATWLAGSRNCEPVAVRCPAQWGISMTETPAGETGHITTYRFFPHLLQGEGFTVTALRKPGGKVRPSIKQVKRSLLKGADGNQARQAAGRVVQPGFMKFAAIGEDIYGFYTAAYDDILRLSGALNIIYSGVAIGRIMKGSLRPDHSLALFHDVDPDKIPTAEVDLETALDFLRKRDIPVDGFTEGYNLVAYDGYPLGWVKRIGGRINNMLPKELRILNG